MATQRAPARELILAQHRFPGPYVIKAFGPGQDGFRADVRAALADLRYSSTERATPSGRRICITLVLEANAVEDVLEVYARLGALRDLKLIL